MFEARKKTLAEEHQDTLISMSDVARSYSDHGQKQEALDLFKKVFQLSKEISNGMDLDIFRSMSNLAIRYHDLGQNQKALDLNGKAFELIKKYWVNNILIL